MTTVTTGSKRRRKLIGRRPVANEPTVDLGDQAHVWWSERDEDALQGPPRRRQIRVEINDDESPKTFSDSFTNDSLFSGPDDFGEAKQETAVDPKPGKVPEWALVTLGLTHDAGWKDIVRAHRRLAKVFHPDVNGVADDGDTMREINQAYAELRTVYDR